MPHLGAPCDRRKRQLAPTPAARAHPRHTRTSANDCPLLVQQTVAIQVRLVALDVGDYLAVQVDLMQVPRA
jgi:hypothetical protein